jgi:hypothetical protein
LGFNPPLYRLLRSRTALQRNEETVVVGNTERQGYPEVTENRASRANASIFRKKDDVNVRDELLPQIRLPRGK